MIEMPVFLPVGPSDVDEWSSRGETVLVLDGKIRRIHGRMVKEEIRMAGVFIDQEIPVVVLEDIPGVIAVRPAGEFREAAGCKVQPRGVMLVRPRRIVLQPEVCLSSVAGLYEAVERCGCQGPRKSDRRTPPTRPCTTH